MRRRQDRGVHSYKGQKAMTSLCVLQLLAHGYQSQYKSAIRITEKGPKVRHRGKMRDEIKKSEGEREVLKEE